MILVAASSRSACLRRCSGVVAGRLGSRHDPHLVLARVESASEAGESVGIPRSATWVTPGAGWSTMTQSEPVRLIESRRRDATHFSSAMTIGTNNDVVVRAGRSIVLSDDESRFFSARYCKLPGIVGARGRHVVMETPVAVQVVPRGIYVGSFAADNWFHWVTRFTAGATLIRDLPVAYQDWPLLVPAGDLPHQHHEILRAVIGDRPVLRFPAWEFLEVAELVWVGPVTRGLNHVRSDPAQAVPFAVEEEAFASLRSAGLGLIPPGASRRTPPRVFLDRGGDARRDYNRDEVTALLDRYGFIGIRSDRLTVAEQIAIINAADVIVGPTGAAWTNALWMRHGARGLVWMPMALREVQPWSTLAAVGGGSVEVHGYPFSGDFFRDGYRLDLDELEEGLLSILDAGARTA